MRIEDLPNPRDRAFARRQEANRCIGIEESGAPDFASRRNPSYSPIDGKPRMDMGDGRYQIESLNKGE